MSLVSKFELVWFDEYSLGVENVLPDDEGCWSQNGFDKSSPRPHAPAASPGGNLTAGDNEEDFLLLDFLDFLDFPVFKGLL